MSARIARSAAESSPSSPDSSSASALLTTAPLMSYSTTSPVQGSAWRPSTVRGDGGLTQYAVSYTHLTLPTTLSV